MLRPLQLLLAVCLLLQVVSARADDAKPAIEEQDPLAPRSTSDLALLVGRVAEARAQTERQIEALTSLEDRLRTLDSALNLELRVWVDKTVARLHTRSRILRAIDSEFRKHGIVIAFPQRDVHLHLPDTTKE